MRAKNANIFSETTSILTGTCKMYMKYPNMLQATVLWRICALTNFNFVNMGSFENIKETAPFRGVCVFIFSPFFQKCYWWAFKQSENKPNSTRRLCCSSSISVHFTFSRLRINSSYRFNSDLKLEFFLRMFWKLVVACAEKSSGWQSAEMQHFPWRTCEESNYSIWIILADKF